jgi:hypothetical protein
LKGINQLDIVTVKKGAATPSAQKSPGDKSVPFLQEKEILVKVKARIRGELKDDKKAKQAEANTDKSKAQSTPTPTPTPTTPASSPQPGLPITARIQGITLQAKSIEKQPDALVINVSLQNAGDQTIRFDYGSGSLTAVDDQNRSLSPTAEGLPAELPAQSQAYSGTIKIPLDSVTSAQTLTLALTDYPNAQIILKLSDIPVTR